MSAPPRKRTPAIVTCLYNMLVGNNLIEKTVPYDVYFAKDFHGVNLFQPGKETVYIALGWVVTVPEADESIETLNKKLRDEGYVRYNSRINFNTPSLQALLSAAGPDPNNPHPDDGRLLEAMQHVRDMMGERGPEAMAAAMRSQREKGKK